MLFTTILAAALANTAPVAVPASDRSFAASCRRNTATLEDIKKDEVPTRQLIESAIEIIKLGGPDEHLHDTIELYARLREQKGRVENQKDLTCLLANSN